MPQFVAIRGDLFRFFRTNRNKSGKLPSAEPICKSLIWGGGGGAAKVAILVFLFSCAGHSLPQCQLLLGACKLGARRPPYRGQNPQDRKKFATIPAKRVFPVRNLRFKTGNQRAANPPEFAQPRLSRVKGR